MQLAYYDQTSSSGCIGSPIVVSYSTTPCEESRCEIATVGYRWKQTVCSLPSINTPDSFSDVMPITWSRHYVVKETFTGTSYCEKGTLLQAHAVAADDMCHPLTTDTNHGHERRERNWVKANCNGNDPIWSSCYDDQCKDCIEESSQYQTCRILGSASSSKMRCIRPNITTVQTTRKPTATVTTDLNDIDNSEAKKVSINSILLCLLFIISYKW